MRVPTMTTAEAEAVLGPRGRLTVDSENRRTVRKWLVAKGMPSAFAAGLSMRELGLAYNDITGVEYDRIIAKLDEAKELERVCRNGEARLDLGELERAITPAPKPNGHGDGVAAIRDIILGDWKPEAALDSEAVRTIVQEEIKGVAPRVVEFKFPDRDAIKVEGTLHPQFERIVRLLAHGAAREKSPPGILLVGPAGCGKTHLCRQVAEALGATFDAIHGSAGASESALTGWLLPGDGGKFEYVPAPFVTAYGKDESVFLFDELDAFDANMLLTVNGALANGHLHIAHKRDNPTVSRGRNVYIMATANTWGTGANPMYSGRSPLDASTLDRFLVIDVDYDVKLEERIGTSGGLTTGEMQSLWELRGKVRDNNLRRCISTRVFQKAAICKAAGDDWKTTIATLVCGWSRDEKQKAGV